MIISFAAVLMMLASEQPVITQYYLDIISVYDKDGKIKEKMSRKSLPKLPVKIEGIVKVANKKLIGIRINGQLEYVRVSDVVSNLSNCANTNAIVTNLSGTRQAGTLTSGRVGASGELQDSAVPCLPN